MESPVKTLQILLLEDNALDAELTLLNLEEGGIPCAWRRVETRADFVAALAEGGWDVILADFSLPSFDGIAALEITRERCPEIPFLFVSGALGEELAIETLKSGATDYVLKQRLERLVPSVRRALREASERAERKRAEEALRFLAEASSVLSASLEYDVTLQSLARLAVPFLADWCGVDMLEEDASFRRVAATHVDPSREALVSEMLERYPLDPGASYGPPAVFRTGQPKLVAEITEAQIEAVARDAEHLRMLRTLGPRSGMWVPLVARGRTLGVMTLMAADARRRFERADLALATELARRAALAVDNARLFHEVQLADRRKDEFLAMLAHELRNPLAPILNAVHVMRLRGGLLDPPLERARDVVERQVQHMTRLVDDLLDVSRITRGKVSLRKERVDLAMVMQNAVQTSRPIIEGRRHTLSVSLPAEPITLDADTTRLEQVLANLLNNAAKYTEPGGRIWLSGERQGDEAILCVRDTGVGIQRELLPHVFDMFMQIDAALDRAQGGLGLGLTLVRRLVAMHGGTVEAHSSGPGQGSTFTVRLPRAEGEGRNAEGGGPASALRPPPSTLGTRVVIVEDNADARETLQELLELWGHQVEVADTGAEGVRRALDTHPDAALIDIGLPELDGYEVARRIRAAEVGRGAGSRVVYLVALSGYGQPEDRRRAEEAGFDAYLVKPLEPAELERLLEGVRG